MSELCRKVSANFDPSASFNISSNSKRTAFAALFTGERSEVGDIRLPVGENRSATVWPFGNTTEYPWLPPGLLTGPPAGQGTACTNMSENLRNEFRHSVSTSPTSKLIGIMSGGGNTGGSHGLHIPTSPTPESSYSTPGSQSNPDGSAKLRGELNT